MNRLLLLTCAFAFFASSAFATDAEKADNEHGIDRSIAAEMGYKTMENGAIVYEEVAPDPLAAQTPLEDIAPAAGPAPDGDVKQVTGTEAPTFHYDPLTQTYRRVTVDKGGNSRHDVINTAK